MEPANDNTYGNFGQRMRTARERAGLTQHQVATYVDISQSCLSQIEANQHTPSIDTFRKIFLVFLAHGATPERADTLTISAEMVLFGADGADLVAMAVHRYGDHLPIPTAEAER